MRLLPRARAGRALLLVLIVAGGVATAVWRAPELEVVRDAFAAVEWAWVGVAVAMNVLSCAARGAAWQRVLNEALPDPRPPSRAVVSAFSVGLLANAVLPGRVGEVARVLVLTGRLPQGRGAAATVLGSIFAHRILDVVPSALLVAYVLYSADIPRWAVPGVVVLLAAGTALLLAGVLAARRLRGSSGEELGRPRRLLLMVAHGLDVLRAPGPAVAAALLQVAGWALELLGVWFAFRGFQIDAPFPAAAVVLMVTNVTLAFPFWPGDVGLVQGLIALVLLPYGVAYVHGFGYGIGLQAIEVAVGVGLGLPFFLREGISFARLREARQLADQD